MREFQEFKDSELQLAQLAKELKEGTFVYHMNKAIAAHERGDAKKKQMHLDNAKTARYSMKSTEIAKHKDLLDKYSQMREEAELDEAGAFSYGAKSPRKGSVAYNAMMKRKEQEKNKAPIEPKDQMIGVAKRVSEDVELDEARRSPQQDMDFKRMLAGAMSQDEYNKKWKKGKYAPKSAKHRLDPSGIYHNLIKVVGEESELSEGTLMVSRHRYYARPGQGPEAHPITKDHGEASDGSRVYSVKQPNGFHGVLAVKGDTVIGSSQNNLSKDEAHKMGDHYVKHGTVGIGVGKHWSLGSGIHGKVVKEESGDHEVHRVYQEEIEKILASDEFAALDEESKNVILARLAHISEGVSHDSETHYEYSNDKKSRCNENRATISFRAFLAKLEEAKKYVEEDEEEDEERADERADKKADRRGRKYPVKMHAGDDDGKNLGEEFELDEGQTVKTKTGMIHKGTYGSEYEGNEKKKEAPAVKRGRGRPKKGSDESGNAKKYTFHDLLNRLSR